MLRTEFYCNVRIIADIVLVWLRIQLFSPFAGRFNTFCQDVCYVIGTIRCSNFYSFLSYTVKKLSPSNNDEIQDFLW